MVHGGVAPSPMDGKELTAPWSLGHAPRTWPEDNTVLPWLPLLQVAGVLALAALSVAP